MKSPKTVSGTIAGFNISPEGHYESLLVAATDGMMQVNLPEGGEPALVKGLKIGGHYKAEVVRYEDEEHSDHPVYEMLPPSGTWNGTVKSINYALHGEPNGVVLESGEFVHLKPPRAKNAGLKVGQTVSVEGTSFAFKHGHTVIEAGKIDGVEVSGKKHKKG